MPGIIKSYIHSDSVSDNKAGCMVHVSTQTDFCNDCITLHDWAGSIAMHACGMQSESYAEVIEAFPGLEEGRLILEKALKEKIEVKKIVCMSVE